MKTQKAWRITNKEDATDTMKYRRESLFRHVVHDLKKEGLLDEYKVERVFILN